MGQGSKSAQDRAARLKAALRENLAKRKARARSEEAAPPDTPPAAD